MTYACGHEIPADRLRNMGRGMAREKRIASVAACVCPACGRQSIIAMAHRLTLADGTPYTPEQVARYLAKRGITE